jgi:oxygen-independent coproporphyrinogen-3 oxidase
MSSLGLYLHIPFCVARCRYCAFASSVYDAAAAERYVAALACEAEGFGPWALGFGNGSCSESPKPKAQSRPFSTLYLGGGTPTVLPVELLERLAAVEPIAAALRTASERTVEANPGTVDAAKLGALRRLGFDRVSLGAQSFDDAELALLGRVHRSGEIAEAVRLARAAGFPNLGLDLIFGLPGQRPEGFFASLDAALRLRPEHLSLYGLTYEPGTPLAEEIKGSDPLAAKGSDPFISRCEEEAERAMYLGAVERLAAAGYVHYEIANFALPGRESRHNLNYWTGGEYLGLGAGAASYLGGERRANTGDVAEYCARIESGRSATESAERLAPEKRAREALMLGLRMTAGVSLDEFRSRTGFDAPALFGPALDAHSRAGRVEIAGGRLRLTLDGLLLANSVMADFI